MIGMIYLMKNNLMKKITRILLLLPLLSFCQWNQIGNDINGKNNGDFSGFSVSMSDDGNIVAIGSPVADNNNGTQSGHVRVFTNNSGVWEQLGDDIDGIANLDRFGASVSLSSNGNVIAIGSLYNNNRGEVRVFENNNGSWQQVGNDIHGEGNDDQFGHVVSLSSDGSIIAIGAPYNDGVGYSSGRVQVYENIGNTWQQIGQDINGESAADTSGFSISLSENGDVIAIGSLYGENVNALSSGHVRVYENNGGTWQQIGNNIDGDDDALEFGVSVSLSANGDRVAITSSYDMYEFETPSKTKVYENNAGTWQQLGQDIENVVSVSGTRTKVELSGNGAVLAIGIPMEDISGVTYNNSFVKIFTLIGNVWTQVDSNIVQENPYDTFGTSIALSNDGSKIAIGAPYNNGNGNNSGHVRVFENNNLLHVLRNDFGVDFKLFPNPSNEVIKVTFGNLYENISYNIYDLSGRKIKASKAYNVDSMNLDVSSYPSGIYSIEFVSGEKLTVLKFIKAN